MATSNFTSFLSQLSRRTKIWLSVWLLSVLCGVLVICCPSIFYTDLLRDRDEAGNDRHLILTNIEHDLSSQELYADIQDARYARAWARAWVDV